MTLVVKKIVATSGERGKIVEQILYDLGHYIVETVTGFPSLKKHVGILCRAANRRMIRRKPVEPVRRHLGFIDQ